MDDTTQSGGIDAWVMARVGNAIDVYTDRALNRPQTIYDPAQAYGMDQNGRIYTLGQTNGQITAQVQTQAGSLGSMMPWLLVAGVVLLVMGSK
jgi:hypothetical protein